MKADVETWYSNLTEEQRKIALALRGLVLAQGQDLNEEIKWNQPCFYGNSMVCYIQKARTHVNLGFGKGSELADPDGLLEGSGTRMRHVRIPLDGRLHQDALHHLLSDAIRLDGIG